MRTQLIVASAMLAGFGLGAVTVQGLHAQAKPPAYVVIPILKMNDAAGFKAGVVDKANATAAEMTAAGGQYVVRSEKFISLNGTPPARLVIIKFDSVEKAQAFEKTAGQIEINAARVKTTDSLSFIVEGATNSLST